MSQILSRTSVITNTSPRSWCLFLKWVGSFALLCIGMTGFSRSERKKYEDQKALSLGGKAPKGQKMPYPMLMQRIKRRKEQEREQREGVSVFWIICE